MITVLQLDSSNLVGKSLPQSFVENKIKNLTPEGTFLEFEDPKDAPNREDLDFVFGREAPFHGENVSILLMNEYGEKTESITGAKFRVILAPFPLVKDEDIIGTPTKTYEEAVRLSPTLKYFVYLLKKWKPHVVGTSVTDRKQFGSDPGESYVGRDEYFAEAAKRNGNVVMINAQPNKGTKGEQTRDNLYNLAQDNILGVSSEESLGRKIDVGHQERKKIKDIVSVSPEKGSFKGFEFRKGKSQGNSFLQPTFLNRLLKGALEAIKSGEDNGGASLTLKYVLASMVSGITRSPKFINGDEQFKKVVLELKDKVIQDATNETLVFEGKRIFAEKAAEVRQFTDNLFNNTSISQSLEE